MYTSKIDPEVEDTELRAIRTGENETVKKEVEK